MRSPHYQRDRNASTPLSTSSKSVEQHISTRQDCSNGSIPTAQLVPTRTMSSAAGVQGTAAVPGSRPQAEAPWWPQILRRVWWRSSRHLWLIGPPHLYDVRHASPPSQLNRDGCAQLFSNGTLLLWCGVYVPGIYVAQLYSRFGLAPRHDRCVFPTRGAADVNLPVQTNFLYACPTKLKLLKVILFGW